jgi:hypothetical protein
MSSSMAVEQGLEKQPTIESKSSVKVGTVNDVDAKKLEEMGKFPSKSYNATEQYLQWKCRL